MEFELVIALELLTQVSKETAVGVKPRDLILILVGHQLVQRPSHRFGKTGHAFRSRLLRLTHAFDESTVALGIGAVLILGEVRDPFSDQLVKRARKVVRGGFRQSGRRGAFDQAKIMRRTTAPKESLLVRLDRHAVQLDRAQQCLIRQRDHALLPGIAKQEQIGGDRIAHQRGGEPGGIDEIRAPRARPRCATRRCSSRSGSARSGLRVNSPVTLS